MKSINAASRGKVLVKTLALMTALNASLAAAQVNLDADIVGDWEQPGAGVGGGGGGAMFYEDLQDRGAGPDLGDYAGLPVNDAVRFKAQNYHPDWLTVPEHQCIPHPSTYQERSPGGLTVAKHYDLVTQRVQAYLITGNYGLLRTIWMDGRPHPSPIARHTFEGFSTGRWVGDKLAVQTSHIKAGWIRRNGVATSDQAKVAEFFVRHDDFMTVILAVDDPLYLSEPFVRSTDYRLNPRATTRMTEFGGFVDGGTGPTFYKCAPIDEVDREPGVVPSIMPGENTELVQMFMSKYNLPAAAAFGGSYTMYPEFMDRLRNRNFANLEQPPAAPRVTQGQPNRRPAAATPAPAATDAVQVLSQQVAGKVWMISVGGQNTVVQIGTEGVLVVDPGAAENAQRVLAEIRRLAGDRPIRVVVNTSADPNRIGATPIVAAGPTPAAQRATVIGHENVGLHMGRARADLVPNDMLFRSPRAMYFNGEPIQIIPVAGSHSDSDLIVHFRQSDVIATGNVLHPDTYPLIAEGGSLQGTLDTLNRISGMTVAEWRSQGGTMIVPATGRLYDQGDVAEYRDMVTIVRDRLQHALDKGMSPNEVKGLRYTRDYDGRYGSRAGAGSTEQFVDVALRNIAADSGR